MIVPSSVVGFLAEFFLVTPPAPARYYAGTGPLANEMSRRDLGTERRDAPAGPPPGPTPCLTPVARRQRPVVVVEDALGGAIEVVELARAQRPEEGQQADQAEAERQRDEKEKDAHRRDPPKRSALPITSSEEPDMAMAAISGLTGPALASGMTGTVE